MSAVPKVRQTVCVSFSGVDGSGKSTQIDALRTSAEKAGLHVSVSCFWNDIARLTSLRETTSDKIFKGDKGIGSPDRPIFRRDKNVRAWPMSFIRVVIYTIDAFSTRRAITKAQQSGVQLVIFDRYLYDELANLNLENPLMRLFAQFAMAIAPRPDISFVLDADPEAARARKPEYPVEFVRVNRQAYLRLSRILGDMTIIPPMAIEDATQAILSRVSLQVGLASPANLLQGETSLSQPAA